jgi:hypothetical protein
VDPGPSDSEIFEGIPPFGDLEIFPERSGFAEDLEDLGLALSNSQGG